MNDQQKIETLKAVLAEWNKLVDLGIEDFLPGWMELDSLYDRTKEALEL